MSEQDDSLMGDKPRAPATNSAYIDDKLTPKDIEEIWDGRRRMAWLALVAIILPTLYIIGFVYDIDRIEKLSELMSWFYLALASVVCAYFGFTSWSSIKGK